MIKIRKNILDKLNDEFAILENYRPYNLKEYMNIHRIRHFISSVFFLENVLSN